MKNKKCHTVGTKTTTLSEQKPPHCRNKNHHTVGTVPKCHTVGTVPKCHTVGTVPKSSK